MRVVYNNDVIIVHWTHINNHNNPTNKMFMSRNAKRRNPTTTECIVKLLQPDDTFRIISKGIVKCSFEDNFNKNIGRIHSLTMALKNTNILTKEMITAIWEEYKNMRHGKWK